MNPRLKKKLSVYPNRTDYAYFNKRGNMTDEVDIHIRKLFDTGYNFLMVGRLTEQKGQWFLLRSFKKVVEEYPSAKLFLIGT